MNEHYDQIHLSLPLAERCLVINAIGNAEGAMTALLIIEGNLTSAQKEFLSELKAKLAAAADILINLERVENKA